jgi:hydrogenase nickel incorporation protein HypA/HybF
MHEFPITQNLLALALEHANRAGAARIVRLHLVIGELSSIVDDSIQFYWEFVTKDTLAEGSELVFQRVPGKLRCEACHETFVVDGIDYRCPSCGGTRTFVVDGQQFTLESIDVEGAND